MARVLAIDYGTKRVGIAVTDPDQIIASGLTTVHSTELIDFLQKYCAKEKVETFVVGDPRKLNNEATNLTKIVNEFVVSLARKFPDKKIVRMDERFTSKMAMQSLVMGGVKKKDRMRKELLDEVSATIILQSYLQSVQR
ncbi:MAG: Holliday junction resolvase RuvX [Bacteroidetes bacterium]|nr:Holliday junction resolvase RuvX [Bacteroidota bacterium]